MSTPTYSSDKVNAFLTAFSEYKSSKDAYINTLKKFKTTTDEVIVDHSNASVYSGSNPDLLLSGTTVTTNENVKMYDNYASQIGSNEISNNYYITDININSTTNLSKKQSNAFVQMGLSDISYENITSKGVVHQFNSSVGEKHKLSQGCKMDSVRECDSYAKMSNKQYYGLSSTDYNGVDCYCHVFDSSPGAEYTNDLITQQIDISPLIIGENIPEKISYLGVLFDGGLYTLKNKVYSENFNNLYDVTTAKTDGRISSMLDPPYSNCNPFVGSGVNRLSITDLGMLRCIPK